MVCGGEGAQIWFVEVKGHRFGLCRCRGSGLDCVGVEGLRLVWVGERGQVWFV